MSSSQTNEDKIETGEATLSSEVSENNDHKVEGINLKNILNIASYGINTLFTYGVGMAGWFGAGTNTEFSNKYQTIVTPKGTAFSIWSIIFLFQAIFAVIQLLPRYRSKPMVQDGVNYWYVAACFMQNVWTFFFGFELIPLSVVAMFLLWCSLVGLLYSQYYAPSQNTLEEFWLLRFPFAVHAGWITAALAVNVNLVVVYASAAASVQLAVGIISLAVLHAVSVWVIFAMQRPNYTIACVLAWANGWIYAELQNPRQKISNTFNEQVIPGVAYASFAVCLIIVAQIVIRVTYKGVRMLMAAKES